MSGSRVVVFKRKISRRWGHSVLISSGCCLSLYENMRTFAHTIMLSRTNSTISLQTFAFLETSFFAAAGKKAREKNMAVGCDSSCRTEAQLATAAGFLELHYGPR